DQGRQKRGRSGRRQAARRARQEDGRDRAGQREFREAGLSLAEGRQVSASLYRVIMPVTDIDDAAHFYEAVLGEPGQRVSKGRHYFGAGRLGAILACYDPVADGDKLGDGWRVHTHQYFYFAVDDLERTRAAAERAGAKDVEAIAKMPWGETLFYA